MAGEWRASWDALGETPLARVYGNFLENVNTWSPVGKPK